MDSKFLRKNIKKRKTNVIETKHYDQIAFKCDNDIIDNIKNDKESNSGVFKIMKSVFTKSDKDFEFYESDVKKSSNSKVGKYIDKNRIREYYEKDWRTYQMSDHNLLWTRIKTNNSVKYLKKLT